MKTGRVPVHPRGRGEHAESCNRGDCKDGSSPRARGTPSRRYARQGGCRFIPAGAGNTNPSRAGSPCWPVHPRGRGEHSSAAALAERGRGSSPRARGTLRVDRRDGVARRFIPAGAGNTTIRYDGVMLSSVHPRGRGEHLSVKAVGLSRYGSSPRARGTHLHPGRRSRCLRFIPAGAGNTGRLTTPWGPSTVHPRGRGEHELSRNSILGVSGSSPRARGTRFRGCQVRSGRRFIPAGAGNTTSRVPSCAR